MASADFTGRVACVTGAARGIGRACARHLAAGGANVALVDLDEAAAKETAAMLAAEFGVGAVGLGADLAHKAEADRALSQSIAAWGRLDILVNNAGGGVLRPTLEHDEESVRATIDRNLMTTLWCTLAAVPTMVEAGYGRIVNIGAESVRNGLYEHAVYNAAKGGVHAMCTGLAREFASAGLTFNAVAPSIVLTETVSQWLAETPADDPKSWQRAINLIPLGRAATMEEVASAVAYLASEEAAFITGQVLSVNGGSSMG
jgi:2,3-dihydroxy-2,3-dihydro-p-cumate dehydrogenase